VTNGATCPTCNNRLGPAAEPGCLRLDLAGSVLRALSVFPRGEARAARMGALQGEVQQASADIDAAYWAFTRTRRGVPPVLAVPGAYATIRRAKLELRVLRAAERGTEVA